MRVECSVHNVMRRILRPAMSHSGGGGGGGGGTPSRPPGFASSRRGIRPGGESVSEVRERVRVRGGGSGGGKVPFYEAAGVADLPWA